MLTYFPLIVGKCDFIAPDCLPLCLAAVCNEVEGRNDISKHCQRHNRPDCWVQLAIVYFIGIQYGVVPSYGGITPFVSSKVTIWCWSTITFDEIAPEMACRPVRVQTGEKMVVLRKWFVYLPRQAEAWWGRVPRMDSSSGERFVCHQWQSTLCMRSKAVFLVWKISFCGVEWHSWETASKQAAVPFFLQAPELRPGYLFFGFS